MRKMRGLGLDTWILPVRSPTKEVARVACTEDRIILTRTRKTSLPAEVSHRIYLLRSDTADDQLREIIDVFAVSVELDCLLGRCIQCNTWDWQHATREDVK